MSENINVLVSGLNLESVLTYGEYPRIMLNAEITFTKLLAKFNLSPQSVERYDVVLRDGVRTLRKREHPIRFFIDQSKYDVPTCNTTLPSENFFRRKRPSRFNDEERTTAPTMIELKETFLG